MKEKSIYDSFLFSDNEKSGKKLKESDVLKKVKPILGFLTGAAIFFVGVKKGKNSKKGT